MPLGQKIRDLIYNAWDDSYPCLVASAADSMLPSGFLHFFGTVELHESGPTHAAIFAKLHPGEQTHVGADTGIGALIPIEKAVDARGNPFTN